MMSININETVSKNDLFITNRKVLDHSAHGLTTQEIIGIILNTDPTENKKYALRWILPRYLSGEIRYLEDMSRVGFALSVFHKNKNHVPQKDILKIKTINDLENMVEPFVENKTHRQLKKEVKNEVYDSTYVIYDGIEGKIVIPLTQEASCFWGKGTRWCTAAERSHNFFENYNQSGYLYIIVISENEKYQFHFETSSFMDSYDHTANITELLDQYPFIRRELNAFWDENDKKRIARYGINIQLIDNPSDDMKHIAVINSERAIHVIDNIPEKTALEVVSKRPFSIRYIKNVSENVCLAAVSKNGMAIQYVENPTEEMKWAAINNEPYAISKIMNPSDDLQMLAVQNNPSVISSIINPCRKAQLYAVGQNGMNIGGIKNPCLEVQLVAIRTGYVDEYFKKDDPIRFIAKPSEEAQILSIEIDPKTIRYIKNPSENIQLLAIRIDPSVFTLIEKPTNKALMLWRKLKK